MNRTIFFILFFIHFCPLYGQKNINESYLEKTEFIKFIEKIESSNNLSKITFCHRNTAVKNDTIYLIPKKKLIKSIVTGQVSGFGGGILTGLLYGWLKNKNDLDLLFFGFMGSVVGVYISIDSID